MRGIVSPIVVGLRLGLAGLLLVGCLGTGHPEQNAAKPKDNSPASGMLSPTAIAASATLPSPAVALTSETRNPEPVAELAPAVTPPAALTLAPSDPPRPTLISTSHQDPSQTPAPTARLSQATDLPGARATVPVVDLVVDNRDPGFSTTGHWFVGDGGQSYRGDCAWAPRGIGNIASIKTELPAPGSYEVFAWWCGDPNHDQSERAHIQVYPTQGRAATFSVYVNLQEGAGQWHSLGTYYLQQVGALTVESGMDGNIVADAFRFVYRSPERAIVTPTPIPTRFPWTNHPPTPLEQLTSGDLSARLALVQYFYPHTPIITSKEVAFDDCQAFPRDGCSGTRAGWQVQVRYQDLVVTYRVARDYKHVAIEAPAGLDSRQSLYLAGYRGARSFRVDRYPDDTWHYSGGDASEGWAADGELDKELQAELQALVRMYGSILNETLGGIQVRFYGLGPQVTMTENDRVRLSNLVQAVVSVAWLGQ